MNMWREAVAVVLKYSGRRILVFFFQRCDNARGRQGEQVRDGAAGSDPPARLSRSRLSVSFLNNEDYEPRKQCRGQIGNAVGGDGHDAFWSRSFGFRPKQNGYSWKNRDRRDGR